MLCTFVAFGQYPTQPNKIALGRQTTGDGLIFRTSGQPNWTPSTVFNAWMAIDTTNGNMWTYREGAWFLEVAGDLKVDYPKVINKSGGTIYRGQVVMVDTVQLVQGDQVRIRPAIATMSNSQYVMGVATEDIPNDSTGYITWFGYVREVDHDDIAQTGVTLDVGDILYISATQAGRYTDTEPAAPNLNSTMALVVRKPSANNMTLLVRPWLNEKLGDLRDVDLAGLQTNDGIKWNGTKWVAANFNLVDSTVVSAGYGIDVSEVTNNFTVSADTSELATPYDVSLKQDKLTGTGLVKSTSGTISYITDNSTNWDAAYNDRITSAAFSGSGTKTLTLTQQDAGTVTASFTDLQGVTSVTAGTGLSGGTITTSGTIAADTAAVLVSKSFLSNQGYTSNTGTVTSIATGYGLDGGTITTSGTLSVDTAEVATPYDLTLKQDKLNGTAGRIPYFDSPSELLSSELYYQVAPGNMAPYLGVYQSSPKYPLTVKADPNYGIGVDIKANGPDGNAVMRFSSNTLDTAKARIVATVGAALNFQTGLDTLNRLHIASDGKIAIGNTSPQRTLHVTGEARITDLTTDTPTRIVGADADGDLGAITVGSGLSLSGGTLSATSGSAGTVKGTGAANKVAIWASTDSLYQNSNLHWDNSNGRLGVGTSAPVATFDVATTQGNVQIKELTAASIYTDAGVIFNNTSNITSGLFTEVDGEVLSYAINVLQVDENVDTTRSGGIFRLDTRTSGTFGDKHAFVVYGRSAGTSNFHQALVVDLNNGNTALSPAKGNVGIGTTTPPTALSIATSSAVGSAFSIVHNSNGAYPGSLFGLNIGYNFSVGIADVDFFNSWTGASGGQGGFSFWRQTGETSATNLMRISGNGNIGIGTSTHANRLDVEGGAAIGATYSGTNTAPTNGLLVEGNVGIGVTSPSVKLHVDGDFDLTSNNQTTRNIKVTPETNTANSGTPLTITAGSSATGSTNKPGGTLSLRSGESTGNGGSQITFFNSKGNTSGTASAGFQQVGGFSDGGQFYIGTGHVGGQARLSVNGRITRGAPVTVTGATHTIADATTWLIVNYAGTCTVSLPAAGSWTGAEITIKTITANAVNSADPNVVPITSDTAGTAILPATDGAWALLVSDGTNWIIMQKG